MSTRVRRPNGALAMALALAGACSGVPGDGGAGRVQIFVAPEDTITDGLEAGTEIESVRDGWSVRYQRFMVTVARFRAARSDDATLRLDEPRSFVVDLLHAPAGGYVATSWSQVRAGRWDRFGYDLARAETASVRADGVRAEDFDRMVAGGLTVYIEATLSKPGGRSCRPTAPQDCVERETQLLRWGLSVPTSFDGCAPVQGDSGFAVSAGVTTQIKPTIHGDHWFFTNLTQGVEITERRAQWIVDADLDRDGETTLDELRAVRASDVFPWTQYNLSGALVPIETAYDFLQAQARTLGDFQGAGECPVRRLLP